MQLAEALYKGGMVLPGPGKAEVNGFWSEHERFYRAIMRRRLGLLVLDEESADDALVRRLLEVR